MGFLQAIAASPFVSGFKTVSCAHPACHRWLTQRHLETRKAGIRLDQLWFCSYACLLSTVAERLAQLALDDTGPPIHTSRMPLAMILIQRNQLTYDQFQQAEAAAQDSGIELGELLVQLGFVEEKNVLSARAAQWGVPVFAASTRPLRLPVRIPLSLMRLHGFVPLHFVPSTTNLLVGFLHRVDYVALYAIEHITGCRTQSCFISPSSFELHLQEECLQPSTPAELTFDPTLTPHRMASILCTQAAEFDANELLLSRSRHHLWCRLKFSASTQDLLFRL